jgi:hypothetical protein
MAKIDLIAAGLGSNEMLIFFLKKGIALTSKEE